MNNFIKNAVLLIVVLILSYFTAQYFGSWYDKFAPQYDSLFGAPKEITNMVVGTPFAYVFFIILGYTLFGFKRNKAWVILLLTPVTLFWYLLDVRHIYLPIILGIIAFILAKLLNLLISKLKRPNPPMVIK